MPNDILMLKKKPATPRRGCHACNVKPKPGTPFKGSPCETCVHADSRQIGHGRIVSLETAGWNNRIGKQDGGIVFDGEQITPADDAETDALDVVADDGGATDSMSPEARAMMDAFGSFLIELSFLRPASLYATFALFRNRTLPDVANEMKCSFQNVASLQQNAMKKMPVLRALLRRVRPPKSDKGEA